jgi:hypothetical protein
MAFKTLRSSGSGRSSRVGAEIFFAKCLCRQAPAKCDNGPPFSEKNRLARKRVQGSPFEGLPPWKEPSLGLPDWNSPALSMGKHTKNYGKMWCMPRY